MHIFVLFEKKLFETNFIIFSSYKNNHTICITTNDNKSVNFFIEKFALNEQSELKLEVIAEIIVWTVSGALTVE